MAHCYALIERTTDKAEKLIAVDEKMCEHFGVEPHPTNWFRNWENVIGLGFAMGYDAAKIAEILGDDAPMIEVLNWIDEHYEVTAWRS